MNTPKIKQLTAPDIRAAKGRGRLTVITAYDYPTARLVDTAGADIILVGDSLAMVVLGRPDTLSVTMDEMLHHVKPVAAATRHALVVADMPFGSYQAGVEQAVANAVRCIAEGGARAVKVEGARHVPAVAAMVDAGIPVMGHVGLTPQLVAEFGGFRIQGKTAEAAARIIEEARSLQAAGCFAIVLEGMPSEVAALVTAAVDIPTIGIGAGPDCDGQVLVFHDLVGLFERFTPRFVKRYAELSTDIVAALVRFREEVQAGTFPDAAHSFALEPAEAARLDSRET